MTNIPVYDKTVSYAKEHSELDAYRASYKSNMACREAISEAANSNYSDNTFNSAAALKKVAAEFSLERIAVVVAVSIRDKDHDGRLSKENKAWAKSIPFPKDMDDWGRDRNSLCAVQDVHPGILNMFADAVRKELEQTKTIPLKKPSLVEKLSRPLPHKETKDAKPNDKER